MSLGMGLSQAETKKAAEDSEAEEEGKFLEVEADGQGEESGERISAVNMESSLYAESSEAAEATEDGYF